MRGRRRTLCGALLLVLAESGRGQSLEDLRSQLADDLRNLHFAGSLTGLVLVSDELELSGAHYRFDDGEGSRMNSLALPFHKTFRPWGKERVGLYLEGVVGYAQASGRIEDLYSGTVPAIATAVDAEWSTYGGLVGFGPEFRLDAGLTLAAIVNLGLTRIESRADYSGPGSELSAALVDGIAFNWNALALSSGGAARLDWKQALGKHHELSVVSRYDLRWVDSIDEDSAAQDFSSRSQLFTVRGDVTGPTGLTVWRRDLGWRVTSGYRHFLEGSLFGVRDLGSLGGALELDVEGVLPIGSRLSFSAAAILGDGVDGWAAGLGLQL